MARLGCKCGADMTNTVSPSQNILNIYYYKEAQEAIRTNPEIRLWDFYSGWDEKNERRNTFQNRNESVEYWYCTECKKIYEVQAVSCGKILRVYEPSDEEKKETLDYSELDEIILLWDVEMDEILSSNEKMTLEQYLNEEKTVRYFISLDETTVYVVKNSVIVDCYKKME